MLVVSLTLPPPEGVYVVRVTSVIIAVTCRLFVVSVTARTQIGAVTLNKPQ